MTDRPFSIPDETATIRGESEGGNKGSWEDVYHSEEQEEGHSKPFVKGDRISGGGEGGWDRLMENPGSNPETELLLKDFLREKHPDLIDRDGNFNSDVVGKFGKEFDEWQNSDEEEIKTKVPQQKEKSGDGFINLKLNEKALEKYTTEAERGLVKDFWGLWTHGKNEIGWLGFEVGKNKEKSQVREITNVVLVTKDGERYKVPAHVFRTVFENVLPSKKPGTQISTGFEFVGQGGSHEGIYPGVPLEEVEDTMRKVKIDGKALPDDTIYFMG